MRCPGVRDAVVPDQRLGRRVDRDHPVAVVVVGHEDAAWQEFDERRLVEPVGPEGPGTGRGSGRTG